MTLAIRHLGLAMVVLAIAAGGAALGQVPTPVQEPPSQATTSPDKPAEKVRTGKERLGQKWTDEQRIDNCNVPAEMRGKHDRPDCPEPAK